MNKILLVDDDRELTSLLKDLGGRTSGMPVVAPAARPVGYVREG